MLRGRCTRCSMLCLMVLSTEMERYKTNNSSTIYKRYSRADSTAAYTIEPLDIRRPWSGHWLKWSACLWNVSVCKLARQPFRQGVRLQDEVLEYKEYFLKRLSGRMRADGVTEGWKHYFVPSRRFSPARTFSSHSTSKVPAFGRCCLKMKRNGKYHQTFKLSAATVMRMSVSSYGTCAI